MGDYDSELVDGKYITSVPIISPEEDDDDFAMGNLRKQGKGTLLRETLRQQSKPLTQQSLAERLSSEASKSSVARRNTAGGNVFDRLSTAGSAPRASTSALGSKTAKAPSSSDLSSAGQKKGALSMFKDLTKNLRKNSKEEAESAHSEPRTNGSAKASGSVVTPRDSRTLFGSGSAGATAVSVGSNGVRVTARSSPKVTPRSANNMTSGWTLRSHLREMCLSVSMCRSWSVYVSDESQQETVQ
jgi:hypothetical protein